MKKTWVPVEGSSSIAAFSYDITRDILYIRYQGGKEYEYYKVPSTVFLDLIIAESKGKFVAAKVKGVFEYGHYLPAEPTSDDESGHNG